MRRKKENFSFSISPLVKSVKSVQHIYLAAILAFANKFLLTSPLVAKCLKLKDKTFKEMRLLILFKINTLNFLHKGCVQISTIPAFVLGKRRMSGLRRRLSIN